MDEKERLIYISDWQNRRDEVIKEQRRKKLRQEAEIQMQQLKCLNESVVKMTNILEGKISK